ncbi:MAG: dihydropteroate synthase, partial [Parvularcula sp.]
IAQKLGVKIILMHAQGDPATMQDAPHYRDVVGEVRDYLRSRRDAALAAGIRQERLILDPGIGFGKTLAHNVALLRNLGTLCELGCPVLLGASRKRFIAALDRDDQAESRLGGSLAAALAGRKQGVSWFRVHDVAATRQALAVWDGIFRHES